VTIYLHPVGAAEADRVSEGSLRRRGIRALRLAARRTVLHAKVRIGDSMIETGRLRAATLPEWFCQPMPAAIYLYVPDVDTPSTSRAIAAGAVSLTEPADQPYGDRLAGVQDSCRKTGGTSLRTYGARHKLRALIYCAPCEPARWRLCS
jgi:PhnB protein